MESLKSGVYFTVTFQFGVATFQVLSSHMGLMAAGLDNTALVLAGQRYSPFLPLLE